MVFWRLEEGEDVIVVVGVCRELGHRQEDWWVW